MVSGRKFQEQIGPFFISLAEGLCLALPIHGERGQAISPLLPRRACSCRTIVSRPNTPFQRRSMIRCELINGCSIMAANHRRQVVAGDSAGGGLAVSTAIALRDR